MDVEGREISGIPEITFFFLVFRKIVVVYVVVVVVYVYVVIDVVLVFVGIVVVVVDVFNFYTFYLKFVQARFKIP